MDVGTLYMENEEKHAYANYNSLLNVLLSIHLAVLILNSARLKRICRYRRNGNERNEIAWFAFETIK